MPTAMPTATAVAAPPAGAAPTAPGTARNAGGDAWQHLVASLHLTGAAQQLAANCAFVGREGNVVRLTLDPKVVSLRTPAAEERLQQALSRHYGTAVVLDLNHESVQPVEDTPARRAAQEAEERLVRARARLDDDPTVRALKERFGASVPPDSVKPVR